jgi:hypothetical protein
MYTLVKDDTAPQIKATLTRDDTDAVIDCSGGTVRLYFRKKGAGSVLFTLTAADAGTNLANGIAIFSFGAGNLNLDAGFYEGEIEITYSSGVVETVFQVLDFQLRGDF